MLNFLPIRRHLVGLLLLIGMLMTVQSVDATKPVSRKTIFTGIEFNELLTTVIEEYRKLGFEFKSSKKTEILSGFRLEMDFVYLPKITKDDKGGTIGGVVIAKQTRETEDEYHVFLYGILFDKSIILTDDADRIRREKAFSDHELGLSNVKIRLKKYLVEDN
ncbi:hypothetical protein [Undibacterium curvum]|jgi:hypothetical protein|uniref:Uncharacterized protein n=1 Tax=Undibacterium curvum TaxID=2762294 RepID=A0ABR6ZZV8_9BURK|nr:hypothetical protein [Undibacterium curvum]MBC3930200.1 hypothetical protein [Undibacterium curvum]